jgi:hypothetical protein
MKNSHNKKRRKNQRLKGMKLILLIDLFLLERIRSNMNEDEGNIPLIEK